MMEKYPLKSWNRALSALLALACIGATAAGPAPEIEISTSTDKIMKAVSFQPR